MYAGSARRAHAALAAATPQRPTGWLMSGWPVWQMEGWNAGRQASAPLRDGLCMYASVRARGESYVRFAKVWYRALSWPAQGTA